MKGRLKKINGKWFVEYTGVSYSGGNPKQLGSYTKKVEQKRLPLHPGNVEIFDELPVYIKDGDSVKFKQVLVNPMGREVDPNNLGQNHSGCVWYAELLPEKKEQKQHLIDIMKSDEELGLYDEPNSKEIKLEDVFNEEKKKGVKELIDKHKQERMYSKEDMAESFMACWKANVPEGFECKLSFKEWFEQFKKK